MTSIRANGRTARRLLALFATIAAFLLVVVTVVAALRAAERGVGELLGDGGPAATFRIEPTGAGQLDLTVLGREVHLPGRDRIERYACAVRDRVVGFVGGVCRVLQE